VHIPYKSNENDRIPSAFVNDVRRKYGFVKKHPSTGFIAILYVLLYLHHEVVYITNFEFCIDENEQVRSRKNVHYYGPTVKVANHEWAKEKQIMNDLIAQGVVREISIK
jgi:hypothetical protein